MRNKLSEMDLSEMESGLQYALEYLESTMRFKFAMDSAENEYDIISDANELYSSIKNIEHKAENASS